MRKAHLERYETGDQGTYGRFQTDSGFECYMLELPWHDNKQNISCIPAGTYKVEWAKSPTHGHCYHLRAVKNRDGILIHPANWAGDVAKGLISQLHGCLAPGRAVMDISIPEGGYQQGVTSSRDALTALINDLEKDPFELNISWRKNITL